MFACESDSVRVRIRDLEKEADKLRAKAMFGLICSSFPSNYSQHRDMVLISGGYASAAYSTDAAAAAIYSLAPVH